MTLHRITRPALFALALLAGQAHAQATAPVAVDGAWARATVQGLVGASSPAAGVTEVHEMKMEGDIMKMRAIPALDLPAGKTVELKPGGYHVMLMDLKAPLAKGSNVPVTLVFQDAKGAETQLPLQLPVASQAPGAAASGMGQGAAHGNKH